jgi:large subunit ribosomal protein L18
LSTLTSLQRRQRRHRRARNTIVGTPERPRLCVFRSNKRIYAQVIDDTHGHTLAAAGSHEADLRPLSKAAAADAVGRLLAERAVAAGLTRVVFDRGGLQYHGRVKALADGAREGGLVF